jgi:hypothetical protein
MAGHSTQYVFLAFLANGGPTDLAQSITDGLGVITTFTYQPLTQTSVYSKDTNATYPLQDIQAAMYGVSRVDSSNGIGGTYSSAYTYAGAKADMGGGRGFLGFRQMTATDLQTGVVVTTNNRQDFSVYRPDCLDDEDTRFGDTELDHEYLPVQQCERRCIGEHAEQHKRALPGVGGPERRRQFRPRRNDSVDGDDHEPI